MRTGIRRFRGGLLACLCTALLLGSPFGPERGEAVAADIQFYLTNTGDGWDCSDCCFTGYCCSVPIKDCEEQPT